MEELIYREEVITEMQIGISVCLSPLYPPAQIIHVKLLPASYEMAQIAEVMDIYPALVLEIMPPDSLPYQGLALRQLIPIRDDMLPGQLLDLDVTPIERIEQVTRHHQVNLI